VIPEKLRPALKDLVNELINGNYAKLEADGRAGRLTAQDLKNRLTEYGRTFIPLPDAAFDQGDTYTLVDGDGKSYGVDLDLWTTEEGKSDLTLQLTVRDTGTAIVPQIDDLQVL
jgi:hypothetical protein